MAEKRMITQRDILTSLQQRVVAFPSEVRPAMSEALNGVPGLWNGAVSNEPFPDIWRSSLRERICQLAQQHLARLALQRAMPPLVESRVRASLKQLGREELTK